MAIIEEIIRLEDDGTISFGDYLSEEKKKAENFKVDSDMYNVKTHNEITRLEKNGKLLIETVPGAVVHNLAVNESAMDFKLIGADDTRVTVELEPEQLYKVVINDINIGNVKSTIAGKVIFSLDLDEEHKIIQIIKCL